MTKRYAFPILLSIAVLWIAWGVFPLVCYEGDSMHVIAGSEILTRQGLHLPPDYSYMYDMQPLVTLILVGLRHLLPTVTCEEAYCLLTALAGIFQIIATIFFVERLTTVSKPIILLAVILLPESYAIAMYPNTSIFACLAFTVGGLLLLYKKILEAAVLFCIAPFFRIDILTVYPVIFFLLLRSYQLRPAVRLTLLTAIVVLCSILCGSLLYNYNLIGVIEMYLFYSGGFLFRDSIIANFLFYIVINILLLLIGMYRIVRCRQWLILATVLCPLVLVHSVFLKNGCASKHYLYLIPFIAIANSIALEYFRRSFKSLSKNMLLATLVLLAVVGVRWDKAKSPADKNGHSLPAEQPYQQLATVENFSIGIGGGQPIMTQDEVMLVSGHLFYPFIVHNIKDKLKANRERVTNYLQTQQDYDILTFHWEEEMNVPQCFILQGYRFQTLSETEYVFSREQEKIRAHLLDLHIIEEEDFSEVLHRYANPEKRLFIIATHSLVDYQLNKISQKEPFVQKVMSNLYMVTRTATSANASNSLSPRLSP